MAENGIKKGQSVRGVLTRCLILFERGSGKPIEIRGWNQNA